MLKIQVGFPVFALSFYPDENKILIGGGGGPNKGGVKNGLVNK